MTKIATGMIHIFLFLASFFIARWFFMDYLYIYSLTFFPSSGDVDFIIPLIQIFIITVYLYIFFQSFISKKIPKWSVYVFYLIYFTLLFFVLFLKNIGIRGIEYQPLTFFYDFFSLVVFLNIIMFIPLGFLIRLNKKNLIFFVLFITLVEITQYTFSLGILDIGDILANTAGFIIGSSFGNSKFGLKISQMVR